MDTRRSLTPSLWLGLLLASATGTNMAPAVAEDYPSRNIAIVLHTSAGGPLDTMVRNVAELLKRQQGWSVRVENRPGGNGSVAMSSVMLKPADGYTILAVTSTLPINYALGRADVELSAIEFLTTTQGEPSALVVRKDSSLKTLADYVNALKAKPDSIKIGGSGQGGNDLVHFRLNTKAGIKSTWVPFDSGPEAVVALAGGHVDVAFLTPSSALGQVQNGDFRMLAVSSADRLPKFPDVPTFRELGYDIVLILWRGFVAKAGTSPEIVAKLQKALAEVQKTPEWQQMMDKQGQQAIVLKGSEFKNLVIDDIAAMTDYYKAGGLR